MVLLCTHLRTSVDILMHPLTRRQLFVRVHRCDPRPRCGFQSLLTSDFHRSTDNGALVALKACRDVKNAGCRSQVRSMTLAGVGDGLR